MKTCPRCQISYPDVLEFCPGDGAPLPGATGRSAAPPPIYDALIGTTVDNRYRIEAKLGEGGMGVVYAVRHVVIDRRLAMKVLKVDGQDDPTAGQRFIQEAKSASRARHPNIVDITDFGFLVDGSAYFIMEFLDGQTLAQLLRRGPIEPRRTMRIAIQIAGGLEAAHQTGVIHRDLKPDNVFLTSREGDSDFIKIVDFGIARVLEPLGVTTSARVRLTQAGIVLGTPEYMSPEQATGKNSDHRVDEYALGCIMFEMLTGEVPYRADTSAGTLARHVFEPVPSARQRRPELDIPPALDALVIKAMAKDQADRYPSMRELGQALAAIADAIARDPSRLAALTPPAAPSAPAPTRGVVSAAVQNAQDTSPGLARRARHRLRPRWLVVGVGILAALAMAVWFYQRIDGPARSDRPPPGLDAADPAITHRDLLDPPPREFAPPAMVQVMLRSEPEGADVYEEGTLIGQAPLALSLPIAEKIIEFKLMKHGFEPLVEKVVISKEIDKKTLSFKLVEIKKQKPRRPSSGRSTASPGRYVPRNNLRDPFRRQ